MKNYIKKDTFTPIAMKCTKEQFEEIKPILKDFNVRIAQLTKFDNHCCYIINDLSQTIKPSVTNCSISDKKKYKNLHETFNAETFLNACGIFESEETLPIKKTTLLQLAENNSFSESIIKKEFPQLFESELVVGKWYKSTHGSLLCFQGKYSQIDNSGSYGFNTKNEWYENIGVCKDYKYKPATEQEVFEALKNEAVKRGLWNVPISYQDFLKADTPDFDEIFDFENNILWSRYGRVFDNGTWSEIIDQPKEITISERLERIEKHLGL